MGSPIWNPNSQFATLKKAFSTKGKKALTGFYWKLKKYFKSMWSFFKVTNCELWSQISLPTWRDDKILIFFAHFKTLFWRVLSIFWFFFPGKVLKFVQKICLNCMGVWNFFPWFPGKLEVHQQNGFDLWNQHPSISQKRIFWSSWFTKNLKIDTCSFMTADWIHWSLLENICWNLVSIRFTWKHKKINK